MRTRRILTAGVLAACLLASEWSFRGPIPTAAAATSPSRPNIVIIVADDMGWRDVGYHGSEIRTPNIDALAAQGVNLDRFYVQPTCSPTRAALLTGRSAMRLGVTQPLSKLAPTGLPIGETLLPQYLKSAGYQTFMAGKWHLGSRQRAYLPNARGFDHFYGYVSGGIGYWDHVHGGGLDWQRDGRTLREEGYSTTLLANEAIRLIEGRDTAKPMLLYAAFGAPHLPNEAPPEAIARYADIANPYRRTHAAMVSELDAAIGRVVGALEAQGILDNTIIWFMSDNGGLLAAPPPPIPPLRAVAAMEASIGMKLTPRFMEFLRVNSVEGGSDNRPLKGDKATVQEGGARVPAIVSWRGRLTPRTSTQMVTVQDVLPTLLRAASLRPAQNLDGRDMWAAIRHGRSQPVSDYVIQATKGGAQDEAIYRYPWKLIRKAGAPQALYNVAIDPTEDTDLADRHPEIVKALSAALTAFPRGPSTQVSIQEAVRDPDFFGGAEDRPPWADTVTETATGGSEKRSK